MLGRCWGCGGKCDEEVPSWTVGRGLHVFGAWVLEFLPPCNGPCEGGGVYKQEGLGGVVGSTKRNGEVLAGCWQVAGEVP